jgi:hypothetical protein
MHTMKYVVWALLAVLVVLHQDYWQWDNATLVWGFLPHTIAWHAALSIGCAVVWALAVFYCWPKDVDLVPTGPDPLPGQSKSDYAAVGSAGIETRDASGEGRS